MSNIRKAFERGKAFIPFVTCGDPDLNTTEEIILAMAENGADLIELGIPFSDPTAEGPVIMGANARALAGGVTPDRVLEFAAKLRSADRIDIPMVFMTYANVLFSNGLDDFINSSSQAGMDGFILPDVPFEEKEDFDTICARYGMDLISMIAPTSHERIRMIAGEAKGFLYCVSSLGVTGTRTNITTDIGAMTKVVREVTDVPAAIGFGISTPEQAADMASKADGVIVGSAIMKIIADRGKASPRYVGDYVKGIKTALEAI